MKTIGLIAGMSWESSLEYYRIINETVQAKLGGFHSAKSIMYSVDFDEVERLQHQAKWEEASQLMIDAGQNLKRGGADFIVICTNTMHKMADDVQQETGLPVLHIADVTAAAIKQKNLSQVGLLGSRFTMEEDFYTGRLQRLHGIVVLIPEEKDRQVVHDIIYNELVMGKITESSRQIFKKIIGRLHQRGAEGVILGCTEIPLLVKQKDYDIPLFDTTTIHAIAAVDLALGE